MGSGLSASSNQVLEVYPKERGGKLLGLLLLPCSGFLSTKEVGNFASCIKIMHGLFDMWLIRIIGLPVGSKGEDVLETGLATSGKRYINSGGRGSLVVTLSCRSSGCIDLGCISVPRGPRVGDSMDKEVEGEALFNTTSKAPEPIVEGGWGTLFNDVEVSNDSGGVVGLCCTVDGSLFNLLTFL